MAAQLPEQLFTRNGFAAVSFGKTGFQFRQFVGGQANLLPRLTGEHVNLCAFRQTGVVQYNFACNDGSVCDFHMSEMVLPQSLLTRSRPALPGA